MDASIVAALCSRAGQMAPAELRALRHVLGVAISGLDAEHSLPTDPRKLAAIRAIQDSLFHLTNYPGHIPDDGMMWTGRPAFVTDAVLAALQCRARAESVNKIRSGKHFFVECPAMLELLPPGALASFLQALEGGLQPRGKANLQYYEAPGECIGAHVDVDDFGLSGVMLLRHEHQQPRASRLWVFPRGQAPKVVELEPGHMVIFCGQAVIHQRTAVAAGEQVTTLAINISASRE